MGARRAYRLESRIGEQSGNPWIRKSAEVLGWLHSGEHEFLWELAIRPVPGHVLEIGTWQGKSTCILAGATLERRDDTRVICVDTFRMNGTARQLSYYDLLNGKAQGTFYEFMANAERLGFSEAIVPIAASSLRARAVIASLQLRLAFIDGQHDYQTVATEAAMVLPRLAPGGVIAFHDAYEQHPDVLQAVADTIHRRADLALVGRVHCLVAYARGG